MNKKYSVTDVGVIVGRFQVDELHPGHIDLIETVVITHPKVFIFLGLSPIKCTINNPLDFESRKQMILQRFPEVNVLYIKDMSSDHKWSKNLDEMITDLKGPRQTVTLYGGRDSFINHYKGTFATEVLEQDSFTSGTNIRKGISNKVRSSSEFRAGVIWATMNQYVNAIPCVDIAIFNETRTKMLMARKANETKYRFVGGHVDAGETYEDAAKREVKEETGLDVVIIDYICSHVVFDWRHNSEKTDITTILYTAEILAGKPEAKDDIEELLWVNIIDFPVEKIVKGHIPLYYSLGL